MTSHLPFALRACLSGFVIAMALAICALCLLPLASVRAAEAPLLLRFPAMSQDCVVFEYADQVWRVPRAGGVAVPIAAGMKEGNTFGENDNLRIAVSPNGKWVAYSAVKDQNTDVYVVSMNGGEPRRLTWHPGRDIVVGWSADGTNVVFRSHRDSRSGSARLFMVSAKGGFPSEVPLPMAVAGSFSPDGHHLAYVPFGQWEQDWYAYKGGQQKRIWISDLATAATTRIPAGNWSDRNPMWVGDKVYYLSNQDGSYTLYDYDVPSATSSRLIPAAGVDIDSASAGPGGIVYSQFGQLKIYSFETRSVTEIPVRISEEPKTRAPGLVDIKPDQIQDPSVSPRGDAGLFEAHGDIVVAPVGKSGIHNLTRTPGVMERDPAWSPDGRFIGYFSDKDGEYDLHIKSVKGTGDRIVRLGDSDAFYSRLEWASQGERLLFEDQKGRLWMVDLSSQPTLPILVADLSAYGISTDQPHWSPAGDLITFTRILPNHLSALFVYRVSDGETFQVTDGSSKVFSPRFDPTGRYLFFLATTSVYGNSDWSMRTLMQPKASVGVYVAVLDPSGEAPAAPRAPGKAGTTRSAAGWPSAPYELSGIAQRVVPLTLAPGDYRGIAGVTLDSLLIDVPAAISPSTQRHAAGVAVGRTLDNSALDVIQADLRGARVRTLLRGVQNPVFSPDGNHAMYRKDEKWFITKAPTLVDKVRLPVQLLSKGVKVRSDPPAEWRQMFRDVWRIERGYFFDANYNGYDVAAAEERFLPYVAGIGSEDDLNFLFRKMLSYFSVGHMFVSFGDFAVEEAGNVGLLGADIEETSDGYRISRILCGDRWNQAVYAPLCQPGMDIKRGDYVVAVNGRRITTAENFYKFFDGLGGKTVELTVTADPDRIQSRSLPVRTITNDVPLRDAGWISKRKAMVDSLSGGRLAYVYMLTTSEIGFQQFNRYFFSQTDRKGVILDERFNGGGFLPDYVMDVLGRVPQSRTLPRWGLPELLPAGMINGPKVMVTNQMAGSGGDAMPWYFKMMHLGTVVGQRTWGGLVGMDSYPSLMNGGWVTAPSTAITTADGRSIIENHGVQPDVEVWQDPAEIRRGGDPQLERAVDIAMRALQDQKTDDTSAQHQPGANSVSPVRKTENARN